MNIDRCCETCRRWEPITLTLTNPPEKREGFCGFCQENHREREKDGTAYIHYGIDGKLCKFWQGQKELAKLGEFCQKGVPYCYCGTGWPSELQCPDCNGKNFRLSRCECPFSGYLE